MPIPETVRVKLSSEAAGSVSLTPVVSQDLPFADLLAIVMTSGGEEPARVHEILKRGSIVSGATRYRWAPVLLTMDELGAALESAPRSDPSRPFDESLCARAVIHSGLARVEVSRAQAARRRLFQRQSFWDAMLAEVKSNELRYVRYVHKDKEDCYSIVLGAESGRTLQSAARLLKFASLAQSLKRSTPDRIDLFVPRHGRPARPS